MKYFLIICLLFLPFSAKANESDNQAKAILALTAASQIQPKIEEPPIEIKPEPKIIIDDSALNEVNTWRARRGLRPYIYDECLTIAARGAAAFRAANLLFGHTSNDMSFLPSGSYATTAGCAAYEAHYGWLSCCMDDNYTFAGAAWAMGRDGKRYMHIFCR